MKQGIYNVSFLDDDDEFCTLKKVRFRGVVDEDADKLIFSSMGGTEHKILLHDIITIEPFLNPRRDWWIRSQHQASKNGES